MIGKGLRCRIASWRDALTIGLPALLLLIVGFWLAAQFVQPAPPRRIILSTGSDGGGYQHFAARYKSILQRDGIELLERPSAGSLENLQRLRDEHSGIDAGFVQGGTPSLREEDRLVSLGGLYHEPLWIFYRAGLANHVPGGQIDQIIQLKGRRIAIGTAGSGTHKLAMELLEANELSGPSTEIIELTEPIESIERTEHNEPNGINGLDAAAALREGRLDAVITVGPVQSALVWSLLYSEGVKLMNLAHAEAYTRRLPYLRQLTLPRGAIDLVRNVPANDTQLLAPLATLVVRADMHPALIDLLLHAAQEIHGEAGVFQKPREFPQAVDVDFPLAPEAERYYKSGKSFLQRYLPFWLVTLIDRLIVFLVPVVALLIPVLRFAPPLYGWRVRSRIFRRYGELKFLEGELELDASRHTRAEWLARLDEIEDKVNHLPTPLAFSDMIYTLRGHIELVRASILRRT